MNRELHPKNYKRISLINWVLCVPLLVLFAFPYLRMASYIHLNTWLAYPGALLFSTAFSLTILHGHVTMALGSVHRSHYYHWLEERGLTYGLFFHPIFTSTRFRLILLVLSGLILLTGWIIKS